MIALVTASGVGQILPAFGDQIAEGIDSDSVLFAKTWPVPGQPLIRMQQTHTDQRTERGFRGPSSALAQHSCRFVDRQAQNASYLVIEGVASTAELAKHRVDLLVDFGLTHQLPVFHASLTIPDADRIQPDTIHVPRATRQVRRWRGGAAPRRQTWDVRREQPLSNRQGATWAATPPEVARRRQLPPLPCPARRCRSRT